MPLNLMTLPDIQRGATLDCGSFSPGRKLCGGDKTTDGLNGGKLAEKKATKSVLVNFTPHLRI